MKIVIGLGNPGAEYARTRHNLGFRVVDTLAKRWGGAFGEPRKSQPWADCKVLIESTPVLLVKPMTYMNRSGECTAKVVRNAEHENGNLLVVVDELNLPLGRIRFRASGSAGGHNGLKSIIGALGTQEFHRLRLGIGGEGGGRDYVLSGFPPSEQPVAAEMIEQAADAAECWVTHGPAEVMNRYNPK